MAFSLASMLPLMAQPSAITVHVEKPGHEVSPSLWGIFFEDINCSADGGIYAELVRNRSLEDSDKPEHWSLVTTGSGKGDIAVCLEQPTGGDPVAKRNRRSLRLRIQEAGGDAVVGCANDGYWGMAVREGAQYDLAFLARCGDGFSGPLLVTLESREGKVHAEGSVDGLGADWKQFKVYLTARGTDPQARLVLEAQRPGTIWLDVVSLFPRETWKGHGLRPDLAEMLAGLDPSFVRFPGGCWVEGDIMRWAYRWKDTVGDIAERRTHWNIWQYWATHGLGFHEYLVMCEDLGSEPLFVINCGMSHRENVPMDQMGPFVQDALDAIEYCNGPASAGYGALRAKAGHPAPFNLKYLEIGNENGGPAYEERYALFHDAVKARYPEVRLVANVPVKCRPMDIVDEHYYSNPEFFIQQADRYDAYDRSGPKIYVGEYAVTQGCGQGNLRGAIGEAAFMTGMERNSDIVVLASYAPLFANVNYKKWNPDLINFDSARAYGLPSYHVQKLFSENRGDVTLPVDVRAPLEAEQPKRGAVGVGTWVTQAEFKDLKVTRGGETLWSCDFEGGTKDWKLLGGDWKAEGGLLRQTSNADNVRAIAGDKSWTDYTYSLKARKLGGTEGFLILFSVEDENFKSWWNLGGWGNQRHAIEMGGVIGKEVPGRIETGRWYDIRIELKGHNIKCFLDGKLVHDVSYPTVKALYASATRKKASAEVIIKVVNVSSQARKASIVLDGARKVVSPGTAIVLTSENPADENTLEQPARVAPVTRKIEKVGPTFSHEFHGNSLTVLKLEVSG